jgi:hypothetical protein
VIALVVAVVLAVGAIAAVTLVAVGKGDDGGQAAAALPPSVTRTVVEDAPAASPPARRTYNRGAYGIQLPSGWRVRSRGAGKGSYVESVWQSAADPEVTLLVDHTPGYGESAETGARAVRSMTSRSGGYREIAFAATRLGGHDAWRWEFEVDGKRKVDYFMTVCGTGYAVLGTAPSAKFDGHAADFRRAAGSLEPTC